MAHIPTVPEEEADGLLGEIYGAAVKRAGKVFQILRIMSPNPPVLKAAMDMYLAVMFGPSPLSRARREMIAVVVSAANGCHY